MRFSYHFNVTVTHRRVQFLNNDLNAIVSIIEKCKKCSTTLTCIKRSEFESRELSCLRYVVKLVVGFIAKMEYCDEVLTARIETN